MDQEANRMEEAKEDPEDSSEIETRKTNILLRQRTPLQRRIAATRPVLPPSRRGVATTNQTSFLNQNIEKHSLFDGQEMGMKVQELRKLRQAEYRIAESEPRDLSSRPTANRVVEFSLFRIEEQLALTSSSRNKNSSSRIQGELRRQEKNLNEPST